MKPNDISNLDKEKLENILAAKINKDCDPHEDRYEFMSWIKLDNLTGMIYHDIVTKYCHPHIFIYSLELDDFIAIRLDKPKYYKPKKYTNRLSDTQVDDLIRFFGDEFDDPYKTNWEWINTQYEGIREVFKRGPKKVPNYTKLKNL